MTLPVSIAFADDHPVMLRGVTSLFDDDTSFTLAGQAVCAASALDLVLARRPDIIVMDLSMPGDVFATVAQICARVPTCRVLIYTAFSSTDSAVKALDAGATGFVLKSSLSTDLIEAVRVVMDGQVYITRQYLAQVMNGLRDKGRRQNLQEAVRLNVRERQIVGQLLQARTNREIAQELRLSEKTVKHYMTALMVKLKARNRVEVVIAARQHEAERSTSHDEPGY